MINLTFLFLVLVINLFDMTIISKSKLEKCINNDSNLTTLNCTNKLVLSLSIQNGQLSNADYMEVYISDAETSSSKKERLQNPFRITISKSPVIAEYPCIYLQDFNYKPVEQIIISDVFSCTDGDLSSDPTCGWVTNNNKIIPYSQGFCCKCNLAQISGIDTSSRKRGSACNFLNMGSGSATAHCLRYDKLWYSAYEIKNYRINYVIDIFITYDDEKNNTNLDKDMDEEIGDQYNPSFMISKFKTEKISLSPSNTIALSENKNIIAYLIGDFQPPTPPNNYNGFFLTIPSFPESHTMVKEGPTNWMLIPKNFFTLDGRECNKIGVSYFAFRSQGNGNGCEIKVGECLYNQIYDLYSSDVKLIASGKTPKYLISQDKSREYLFYSYNSENKKFAYKLDGVFNSLITIELIADDIKFITNVSNGQIDYFRINSFESSSNDGMMEIQVTNTGTLTSQFFLTYNCSEYILPLLGNEFSLSAFETIIFKADIFTLNKDFKKHYCNATLKNSIGEINDQLSTSFNTTSIEKINIQNTNMSNLEPNGNKTVLEDPKDEEYKILDCKVLCPEFFGFFCFVAHSCWGYFIRTIAICLFLIILIILLIRWIRNGCLCNCIHNLLEYILGKNRKKSKNKRDITR